MNRALLITFLFVACGPEPLVQEPSSTTPVTEQPPVTMSPNSEQPLTGFPCDVREVLQKNCAECHAGAVYVTHFKSRADLLELSLSGQHQLGVEIALRLRSDATSPMPPAGAEQQPTLAERQLIEGWVRAGMPAGACGELEDR